MNKETMAKMQIEAELAALEAKLTTLSQYINGSSDYGKALDILKATLKRNAERLANAE